MCTQLTWSVCIPLHISRSLRHVSFSAVNTSFRRVIIKFPMMSRPNAHRRALQNREDSPWCNRYSLRSGPPPTRCWYIGTCVIGSSRLGTWDGGMGLMEGIDVGYDVISSHEKRVKWTHTLYAFIWNAISEHKQGGNPISAQSVLSPGRLIVDSLSMRAWFAFGGCV